MRDEFLSHDARGLPTGDLDDGSNTLLEQVRRNAVQLLTDIGLGPRKVHVRAGDVVVEIEWGDVDGSYQPSVGAPPAAEPASPPALADDVEYLTAPTVGVFYHGPEPGADPFVRVGDTVRPGQQVGIVEAMKLMIPVEADRTGEVIEVLKGNGESVEYDEPLLALAARGA